MALGGNIGNGTKVGFSASSPVSYTKIAQLMDVPTFLSFVANDVDTTVHSTSRQMTSIAGMVPVPEVVLTLLADLDQSTTPSHESLRTYQVNGTTIWFRIEIPTQIDQTKFRAYEFQGYVKEYTVEATKIAASQQVKVTIKYSGNLAVYPAGASTLG